MRSPTVPPVSPCFCMMPSIRDWIVLTWSSPSWWISCGERVVVVAAFSAHW